MGMEDIWKAILAFSLGLAAKFIYDLWKEHRERKAIVFKKTILSSFVVSNLEKEIREQTQVFYKGHNVQSIHFVRVELDNRGKKPIKNQAFTVRFSENATILGNPVNLSSSEDMRHVEEDTNSLRNNSRRFLVKLLQRDRFLSWDFGVINHDENDFTVEHGVIGSDEELEKADLDVVSSVTRGSVSPDLTDRISRLISFLIFIIIIPLIQEIIENDVFNFINSNVLNIILNFGIIGLWFAVLIEASSTIRLFMKWLEQRKEYTNYVGGDYITVGNIDGARGVSIGQAASATLTQPIGVDYDTMKELLLQAESIVNVNDSSD